MDGSGVYLFLFWTVFCIAVGSAAQFWLHHGEELRKCREVNNVYQCDVKYIPKQQL